jgi:hypothetical protein
VKIAIIKNVQSIPLVKEFMLAIIVWLLSKKKVRTNVLNAKTIFKISTLKNALNAIRNMIQNVLTRIVPNNLSAMFAIRLRMLQE